jgi:hypothetical protein
MVWRHGRGETKMTTYTHEVTINGVTYVGSVTEDRDARMVAETVTTSEHGVVHAADFHARYLGLASRDEYARVMTASIAEGHQRAMKRAMTA